EHDAGCLTLDLAAGPGWDASYYSALLKDVERSLLEGRNETTESRIRSELARVRNFIDEVRPPGLGLAVFSCLPDALFEAVRLPDDVATRGHFGPRFDLTPLERQLADHPPGVVVLVEKDQARLFAVVLDD